jgi:hypothetical protein
MMIPLLLLVSPAAPMAGGTPHTDPAVQVTFNDDGRYVYGDRARVYVRPATDGYLLVLRSDDRGNVRVLYPLDPDDDQSANGGKKYEVKDRGGREAFVAEDTSGQGTVLAAWSKTPFDASQFDRNGHWDLQALTQAAGRAGSENDPDSRLIGVVDAMEPNHGHYEYDVSTYDVSSPSITRVVYGYPYPYGWTYGPFWGVEPWWRQSFVTTRVVIAPRPFRRFR